MLAARFAAALVALSLVRCATLDYYGQSIEGQMDLVARRQPIQQVLDDPQADAKLRHRLRRAVAVREFASAELGLPDNDSYRSYADLERRYVVWSVFAAEEFSVEPVTWCFPFAGCVAYRGYFHPEDARAFARKLKAQGYHVYVAGVPAYSTLGWFSDPVLNTMLVWPDADVAAMIIHELAHQRLYVRNATTFNESFAVFVEQEGLRRWLQARGEPAAYREYLRRRQQRRQFATLVQNTRQRLAWLYAQPFTDTEKRHTRKRILERMRADYRALKEQWGGDNRYDRWMALSLNNAQLASVGTYHHYVPAFRALLADCNGDLACLYEAAERLGRLPPPARRARLEALMRGR